MYFAAKILQASGLGLLAFGFIKTFPERLNYRIMAVSAMLFMCGWIIERYLLKK